MSSMRVLRKTSASNINYLKELDDRYGLQLTHFQSHYLPTGWKSNVSNYLATFGSLQVFTIDLYDMFLTKLFSIRSKDKDDLRALVCRNWIGLR